MSNHTSPTPSAKRQRFEQSGRVSWKKIALVVVVFAVAVGGFFGYWAAKQAPEVGGAVVQQGGVDYSGSPVQMVLLSDPTVLGDTVELSAAEITANKIGGLLFSRTTPMPAGYNDLPDNGLPILAYVAPNGRLVVATSLCEPCHSYNFHIEGDDLVCNACFTHWKLDTLEGVSGGCQGYPPQELQTTIAGDKVQLQKSVLESWTPRV